MQKLGSREMPREEKVIRIWNGCKVLQVICVSDDSSASLGSTGGAGNSTKVDIEIDPWAGLIVDHSVRNPPFSFREDQI